MVHVVSRWAYFISNGYVSGVRVLNDERKNILDRDLVELGRSGFRLLSTLSKSHDHTFEFSEFTLIELNHVTGGYPTACRSHGLKGRHAGLGFESDRPDLLYPDLPDLLRPDRLLRRPDFPGSSNLLEALLELLPRENWDRPDLDRPLLPDLEYLLVMGSTLSPDLVYPEEDGLRVSNIPVGSRVDTPIVVAPPVLPVLVYPDLDLV